MSTFNRKVESFSQLLGESYFTRNQAFYFALLAIKNAFSLDETRNLQKLRKRRNNTAWYFAQLGNKARKSRDMQAQQELSLTKKASVGLFAAWMLVAPSIPGLGPANARAGDIKEGPKLALNTKAPVMPEGSGTSVAPAAHAPAPEKKKEYSVKAIDQSQLSVREARTWAALASRGSMVVLYRGDSKKGQEKVQKAASDFKNAGGKIRGMVISQADLAFNDGADSYIIMVDGLSVTKPFNVSETHENIMTASFAQAEDVHLKPQTISMNNTSPN